MTGEATQHPSPPRGAAERLLPYYPTMASPYDRPERLPWGPQGSYFEKMRQGIFAAYNDVPASETWDKLYETLGIQPARYRRAIPRPSLRIKKPRSATVRRKKAAPPKPHAIQIRRTNGRLIVVREGREMGNAGSVR